ncbi:hypothetical protein RRG08_046665 [Elysia crispata]|uniref:Uncharacterized protein n=1 Tax=Elysia crispata TaxID=231223 RepID=A0AAE1BBQ8_9GAST|nr:hypothetical protein RRG08_046665 [Elysia crispata]
MEWWQQCHLPNGECSYEYMEGNPDHLLQKFYGMYQCHLLNAGHEDHGGYAQCTPAPQRGSMRMEWYKQCHLSNESCDAVNRARG